MENTSLWKVLHVLQRMQGPPKIIPIPHIGQADETIDRTRLFIILL